MTGFAIVLILLSAFFHASWNLLAKRSSGGVGFVWLFSALASVLYAPVAFIVLLWQKPDLGGVELLLMTGSGLLHFVYFLLLQQGYKLGDLSLVYPLARGTGPLLSSMVAILFLGERPTPLALLGLSLIAIGAFLLTSQSSPNGNGTNHRAIGYGLLVGTVIAAYTLWDKQGVSTFLVPPVLMDYGSNLSRTILLSPVAVHHWRSVCAEWKMHRWEAIGVACLSPFAYILVLTALAFTPVSYVAPLREISILIGVMMGAKLLAEGNTQRRLAGAGVMVCGAVALAIG
ncbi:EamA family transporter [filamentous cyanobacterium CCP2]|nr:EamA family transporter [filamentous cyanobacterium CCP2]